MVTDCPSVEAMIGEVKVMVIEDNATRKAFSFDSASGIKFPFDCVKSMAKFIFLTT